MIGKFLTWGFLAVSCSVIIKIMLLLDLNKKVYNHVPGPCFPVDGIQDGSEDLELLEDGTVLVTSGFTYGVNPDRGVKGKIFLFDFKTPARLVHSVKIEGANFDQDKFRPHGISSYNSKGRVSVYVVNHHPDGDTIECFTWNKQQRTLSHTKTIKSDLIYAANDLVVVGPDRFFVTNDHYFKSRWLWKLETLLMLSLGNLVYYDGKPRLADQWLMTPNGVAVSKNKKHLYVSMPLQEVIRIYNMSADMSLKRHVDIGLLTAPDNIFVDPETDELWVGAHPIASEIIAHLEDPKVSAPSQVLHIRVQGAAHDRWVVTEPYADDGGNLWGSSSAVYYQGQLLVGTVYHKLMHCQVLNPELV